MSEKIAFSVSNLSKIIPPNKVILDNISLSFFYGAKIGIIGNNGAGKTTFLKALCREDDEFEGSIEINKNMTLGYLPQEPQLDENISISENIKAGMKETMKMLDQFNTLSEKMAEEMPEEEMEKLINKVGEIQEELDKKNAWEVERLVDIAMQALNVPSDDNMVSTLSGGEKRRVALCRLLIESPDILILDEPTNHLDAESVSWLEEYLKKFPGTVLTVTHDRYFLDHVANWILEIDRGRAYPYKGNYEKWLEQKEAKLKAEEKTESKRQKSLKKERNWLKQNTKAQQTKNKARIQAYENLLVAGPDKSLEKMEINLPIPPRLGENVIEMTNISMSYNDRKLIDNLSMKIPRGAIVGIIGPNGAGKTTLFKLISGLETPNSGEVKIGETVHISHVGQFRDSLKPNENIWEAISEGEEQIDLGNGRKIHSRAYVGSFNFKGTEQQKKVGTLSGGERNRVHLAKLLKAGGNVLLLDEPTNDLDVATLRSLEEALMEFAGCVLVISHDRYFLDRVCTHILSFEEEGKNRIHLRKLFRVRTMERTKLWGRSIEDKKV